MNTMRHDGFVATLEIDDQAGIIHGRVVNARAVLTFESNTVAGLREAFADTIADYCDWCQERNLEPAIFDDSEQSNSDVYWSSVYRLCSNAKTVSDYSEILSEAIRSDVQLSDYAKFWLSAMLIGVYSFPPTRDIKYTIAVVPRRDFKARDGRMGRILIGFEVALELNNENTSLVEACKRVASKRRRTQRSVELIFQKRRDKSERLLKRFMEIISESASARKDKNSSDTDEKI